MNLPARSVLLFALSALFLASCEQETSDLLSRERAAIRPGGLLPAYETPEERALASRKADWRARSSQPEWYTITEPPAVDGLRAMVEWEPMQANLITYSDYLSSDYAVRQTLVDIAVETVAAADLWVVYQSSAMRSDLVSRMRSEGVAQATIDARVRWFQMANDSIWTIDFAPLPLLREGPGVAFLDWRYYDGRESDDAFPTRLGRAVGATTYRQPFDLEGGNFQADGEGSCYTTQRAFYYGGTAAELELQLRYYAGCDELVVLRDIHSDGTGHIDMFFKLVSPTVAIVGDFTVAQDSRARTDMNWNAALLESRGMTVHRMPMPDASQGVPRTYLNSTLIDGPRDRVNLWPVYSGGASLQAQALAVWQRVLPGWRHVGILSDEISLLSGAVHCVTRTIPDVDFALWVADGVCSGGRCAAPAHGYAGACGTSADCFGPEWSCETNQCPFVEPDCGSDADCADGDPCTVEACVGGRCVVEALCELPYVCERDSGSCVLCEAECAGRDCGDDGCGGSCGSCGAGASCLAGYCTAGCGGLPYEGCCEGNLAWWCDGGVLRSKLCSGSEPHCTWMGSQYGYWCSASQGGVDPSGALPRSCVDYFAPDCVSDADCDDGDACTRDECLGGECRRTDIAGCCRGDGDCADGDPCTADRCVAGLCRHDAIVDCCEADADCADSDLCTTDRCEQGRCAHEALVCPEPGARCVPATGLCVADCVPDCAGRVCGADGCGALCGLCAPGERCDAAGQCLRDAGPCDDLAEGAPCDDGDPCSRDDRCLRGLCVGDPILCPAPDDCHRAGGCDARTGGCAYEALPDGSACNDGDPATGDDRCEAGLCVGTPCSCASDDRCCDGCFPRNEGIDCDDGDPETGDDQCRDGRCVGSPALPWDDTQGGGGEDAGGQTGADASGENGAAAGGCTTGGIRSGAPLPLWLPLALLFMGLRRRGERRTSGRPAAEN